MKTVITIVLTLILGFGAFFTGSWAIDRLNKKQLPEPDIVTDLSKDINPHEAALPLAVQNVFSYQPEAPDEATSKKIGVVELGAKGFNYFIVKIDRQDRWKLEKREFGVSLVQEGATSDEVKSGLRLFLSNMGDYVTNSRTDLHFVVSSGAQATGENIDTIIRDIQTRGYVVNTVTPREEAIYGFMATVPPIFRADSIFMDIGSGNTKISWQEDGNIHTLESYGAKYYKNNTSPEVVYNDIYSKIRNIPTSNKKRLFLIGGVPYNLATKTVGYNDESRYVVLNRPSVYDDKFDDERNSAGLNIYAGAVNALPENSPVIFDSNSNFTIGFLGTLNH